MGEVVSLREYAEQRARERKVAANDEIVRAALATPPPKPRRPRRDRRPGATA